MALDDGLLLVFAELGVHGQGEHLGGGGSLTGKSPGL